MRVSSVKSYNPHFSAQLKRTVPSNEIVKSYRNSNHKEQNQIKKLISADSYMDAPFSKFDIERLPKEDVVLFDCRNMNLDDTKVIYIAKDSNSLDKLSLLTNDEIADLTILRFNGKNEDENKTAITKWLSSLVDFFCS